MVLLQMNPQKQEATDRKLHETQVENYDYYVLVSYYYLPRHSS